MKRRGLRDVDASVVREAFRTFRPALAGQRRDVGLSLGLVFMITVLELARPWPMKFVFDRVLIADGESGVALDRSAADAMPVLLLAVAATFALPVLIGTLNLLATVAMARVSRAVTTRVRQQVFEHLHRLHLPFHRSSRTGDLLVRIMGDVNMVRDLLFASWVNMLARGAVVVGTATLMLVLDPLLGLVAMAPMPFLAVGVGHRSKALKEITRKQRRREGNAAGRAAETLRQIHVVKAYAAENQVTELFRHDANRAERASVKAARVAGEMGLLTEALTGAGLALVVFVGARRVLAGDLTPGDLLVFVSYARSMYRPINKLSTEGGRLSKATACAERLLEVLRIPPEDASEGRPAPRFDGEVSVRDLHYAYENGVEALRGLTFTVAPGSLVVLAGPNGSGKSTLLSILLRLVAPDRGTVLVDGTPIEEFQLDSYRNRIAYVPQDALLFGATVADNIRYGRPGASDEEVEQAARAAVVHDVICELPDGYDTELVENGAGLSGGQARRLMLARAAVRDAQILLLDEPLAGLDSDARPLVIEAIRALGKGRTTIVVSHGPAMELEPDMVIRLADGKVASASRRRPAVGPPRWEELYPRSSGPWTCVVTDASGERGFGVYEPATGAIARVEPKDDPNLRSLAAWLERGELVTYRVHKRAVVRIERNGRVHYAKVLKPREAESVFRRATLLASLADEIGGEFPAVPRVVESFLDEGVVVFDEVPGVSLLALDAGGGLSDRQVAMVTRAFVRFHGVDAGRLGLAASPQRTLATWVAAVETLDPSLSGRYRAALAMIEQLPTPAEPARALVHGDLHDKNILLDGDRVGLLDLDGVHAGDAVEELGDFAAHFVLRAVQRGERPERCHADAERVLAAYADAGGRVAGVEAAVARTLLRLSCLYLMRRKWQWATPALLAHAQSWATRAESVASMR